MKSLIDVSKKYFSKKIIIDLIFKFQIDLI